MSSNSWETTAKDRIKRDRQIVKYRFQGKTTREIPKLIGLSLTRVQQILREQKVPKKISNLLIACQNCHHRFAIKPLLDWERDLKKIICPKCKNSIWEETDVSPLKSLQPK